MKLPLIFLFVLIGLSCFFYVRASAQTGFRTMNLQLHPNSGMEVLYPEAWASSMDELDIGDYGLQNVVSRRNELNGAAKKGSVIHVPLSADLGEADDYDANSAPNNTNIAQTEVQVTLDKSFNKMITLSSNDLTKSPYDLIKEYFPGMLKAILRRVNLEIYLAALESNYIVDARSTFDENSIVDAYKILDQNEVGGADRYLICGPDDYADMLKFAAFTSADRAGDSQALRTGQMPERYGFRIAKNHIIQKYTPADLAGAINNVANYTGSDFTIAVDAFADSALPIRKGDIFTVASESGSPIHTVQSTVRTASNTTSISFLTKAGMTNAAKTDNAVVTIAPTRSILALTPTAIAMASAPYASFEGITSGVRQMIVDVRGVACRLSVWQEGLLVKVSLDCLMGVSKVKNTRIARIITD